MDKKIFKKSFCKWEKSDIQQHMRKIYELTANPKFVCRNCARVARSEDNLCKPQKFKLTG